VAALGDDALDVVGGELGAVGLAGLVEAGGGGLVDAVPGGADDVGALGVALFEGDEDLVALFGEEEEAAAGAGVRGEEADPGGLVVFLPVVLDATEQA